MIYDLLFERITNLVNFTNHYEFFEMSWRIVVFITLEALCVAFAIRNKKIAVALSSFYCVLYGSAFGAIPGFYITHNFFGIIIGAAVCAGICLLVNIKYDPQHYIMPYYFAITQFVFIVVVTIFCDINTEQFFADLLGIERKDIYEWWFYEQRIAYDRHITVMVTLVIAMVVGALITLTVTKLIKRKNVALFVCFQFLGSTYLMSSLLVNDVSMGGAPCPHHVIDTNPLSMGYGYMPFEWLEPTIKDIITYTVVSILIYVGVKLVCKVVGRLMSEKIQKNGYFHSIQMRTMKYVMEIKKLQNGITSITYPISGRKSVDIALYIRLNDIKDSKLGIAHFLEHMHYRQIGCMNQEQLYETLNNMGTSLQGTTYKEMMVFYIKVRPQFVQQALEIVSNLLKTYEWTQGQFEEEKKVILKEIDEKADDTFINSINDELVWKNCCLSNSILGEYETVEDITLSDIVEYKKKIFCAENIAIVISGNYDKDAVGQALSDMGAISFEKVFLEETGISESVQFHRKPDIAINEFDTWSSVDVQINFDVNMTKINNNELIFLSSILGGGDGSILQQVLREKKGLVYDVYSYATVYESGAILSIEFSTDNESLEECIRTIMNITKKMKHTISQKDIDMNITFFTDNLWYWEEEPNTLNFELGCEFIKRKPMKTIEERIEENKKITLARINEISDMIFIRENTSISIMGDTRGIDEKTVRRILE